MLGDHKALAFVALERTRMPIVITDPRLPDNPIVLANNAFLEQTGYTAGEVIGRNCRFLQGPDTDPMALDAIRMALRTHKPVTIELLNYRKDGAPFWNQLHVSPVYDDGGELLYFFASQMDVTDTHRAIELKLAEHALLLEVDHRARNALALVQGVVRLSIRDNHSPGGINAYAESVLGRVDAIALAHALLSDARWRGVTMEKLIGGLIAGFVYRRVEIEGPQVLLHADQVQPLAIVLHELLVGVARYGALATPAGRCQVGWHVDDGRAAIDIIEVGGPTRPSARLKGFGQKIIEQVVTQQLRGQIVSNWQSTGLTTTVIVPVHAPV